MDKHPLDVLSIPLEILAGFTGSIAGIALGGVIGYLVNKITGNPLFDFPQGSGWRLGNLPVYTTLGMFFGGLIGNAAGVYVAGRLVYKTGSFYAALGGNALGGVIFLVCESHSMPPPTP